eukprot:CAMPEP_0168187978 /NCGR_PEP_ID=MMETSP0139_2-20121125/15353_1 /TAXON_ID=44445 /ORGANISM="Pseudo-nitzschia australis, Strain 10249 10 AB" /LENGTH=112 /DNA_ID=CAMNT_0008110287 /DNA_START=97 /DNA_END=436 /DNA_ORIENTATION=-
MSEPKTNGRAESAPEDSSVSMTKTKQGHSKTLLWSRCIGSSYQGDSLYRYGRLDSCGRQWRDLKLAAEARLTQWRDPKRAQELIDSTYYQKRTTISPTAGAIWELKERPGWD